MSTSENIKQAIAKYAENKKQEHLEEISLKDIAQQWENLTKTDNQEAKQNFQDTYTPEMLDKRLEEYLDALNNGKYDIADFEKINNFCQSSAMKNKNTAMDLKIDNLKSMMETKKVTFEHNTNFKLDEKQKTELRLNGLDQIEIQGNQDIINSLQDKTQISGKKMILKNDKSQVISTVEFDKEGNSIITCQENGKLEKYEFSKDKKLYKYDENGNKTEINTQDKEKLSKIDKHAGMSSIVAQKAWNKYLAGELKPEPKRIKINEGEKNKANTVINEGENSSQKPTTRINEEEAEEKNEGEFNTGTDNQYGPEDVKLDWKEEDIIKAMFEKWFIAGINAVAEWTIEKCNHVFYGVLNEISSGIRRKPEKEEKPKPNKEKDYTQQFYEKVEETSSKKMENNVKGLDLQSIKDDAQAGKFEEILAKNEAIRNFAKASNTDIKQLLTAGDINKTAPLLATMSAQYAQYADNYAKASLLDDKLQDKRAHENQNPEDLYDARVQEAGSILKNEVMEFTQKNKTITPKDFEKIFGTLSKDMKEAVEIGTKDYKKGRYDENGKQPKANPKLAEYRGKLNHQEPQTLQQEANQQKAIDDMKDATLSGLKFENENLVMKDAENNNRKNNFQKMKNLILNGYEVDNPNRGNNQQQIQIPLKIQGRE